LDNDFSHFLPKKICVVYFFTSQLKQEEKQKPF
jgi:hypothetical protein